MIGLLVFFGVILSLLGSGMILVYSRRTKADWVIALLGAILPAMLGPLSIISGLVLVISGMGIRRRKN